MEWIEMRCRLKECEIDGSVKMDLSKCLFNKGIYSECFQLDVKKHEHNAKGEVWKKLEDMIDKKKNPNNSGNDFAK